MMSDDVSALTALFSTSTARPPGVEQKPDYSNLLKGAVAIGEAGRSIGAARAATKEGEIAQKLARVEAERERMKGRRLVSAARAVAGAQGSGDPGDTLLSELSILQAAHDNANVKLYEGNITSYYAKQKAKAAYMKAPADLLEGLLEISKKPEPGKPGKSLLTGREHD